MGSNTSSYPIISEKTVTDFDPKKYQGVWYGHGVLTNNNNRSSWASQKWTWDEVLKKIFITDTHHISNGDNKQIKGIGTIVSSGKLSISLTNNNIKINYWIHYTDYDNYSIVGNSLGVLWILSRKRNINEQEKRYLTILTEKFGYNSYLLRWKYIPYKTDLIKSITDNKKYRNVITTTKDLQIVEMSLKLGEFIPKEKHNGSQFFLVISGEAKLETLGDVLILKKGESSTVNPTVEHYLANNGKDVLKILTIYSPPEH